MDCRAVSSSKTLPLCVPADSSSGSVTDLNSVDIEREQQRAVAVVMPIVGGNEEISPSVSSSEHAVAIVREEDEIEPCVSSSENTIDFVPVVRENDEIPPSVSSSEHAVGVVGVHVIRENDEIPPSVPASGLAYGGEQEDGIPTVDSTSGIKPKSLKRPGAKSSMVNRIRGSKLARLRRNFGRLGRNFPRSGGPSQRQV